jgi:hypothetical protein
MDQKMWFGFRHEFPGAWGMVGFSRVAFNLPHTQAMVYSSHQCGNSCEHGDTWVLGRKGESWRVVERIWHRTHSLWEPALFPLRYLGLDTKPKAYRRRHVYVQLINAVTDLPLRDRNVTAFHHGDRSDAYGLSSDSLGRVDVGLIPFSGIVGMNVACPDQTQPDSLNILEYLYSPGSDTTITSRINFRECLRISEPHSLTGAQALITPTEARFMFPLRPASRQWDLPVRQTDPGTTDYLWTVDWRNPGGEIDDPISLWLGAGQRPSDPRIGSLQALISGSQLEAMIECGSCDQPAVLADPDTDHRNVFARVENGRIVFIIHGRGAVSRVFPKAPKAVTFWTMVRHEPASKHTVPNIEESQSVVVNCRSSDSTGASRRRCDALTSSPSVTTVRG